MGYPKIQLGAPSSTWYSRYGPPKFPFTRESPLEGQQKIANSSEFWHNLLLIANIEWILRSTEKEIVYYRGAIQNPSVCMYVCIAEIVYLKVTTEGLPPDLKRVVDPPPHPPSPPQMLTSILPEAGEELEPNSFFSRSGVLILGIVLSFTFR